VRDWSLSPASQEQRLQQLRALKDAIKPCMSAWKTSKAATFRSVWLAVSSGTVAHVRAVCAPIQHTMKWSGVLIEASPTNYKALQRNRGGGRAKLINTAVSGIRPV
jgi:hypothetical protein